MPKSNCLFCSIVQGSSPSHVVGEDDKHLAILTPFPNTPGVTVVLTRQHHPSYVLAAQDDDFCKLMLFAKRMGRQIDRNLGCQRTGLIAEGFGIDHLHVKLFPMHGIEQDQWQAIKANDRTFSERYTGMLSSSDGPRMKDTELGATARQIRGSQTGSWSQAEVTTKKIT